MIEARAAQKLGRSVAVARVLPRPPSLLFLTNREDNAYPGGREILRCSTLGRSGRRAADRRSVAAAAFHH